MIFYRKILPFQAITFDLDDTLYDNSAHMPNAELAFLSDLNQNFLVTKNITKNDWLAYRDKVLNKFPQLKHDMGELRRQILRYLFQSEGLTVEALQTAVEDCFTRFYFHRSNFTVEDNIHSLLQALNERYPLVAITNGNVDLKQIGLAPYFQHTFKANLHQPMKPHSAMFDASRDALGMDAARILHVGDNLHNDVLGAIKAGFQSAWYAHDRRMAINKELLFLLPQLQLNNLSELLDFDTLNLK
jgi:FMN hydrolase / 5-amino-6-(5-phospho-D-ribitylamino)uracil phosphatase